MMAVCWILLQALDDYHSRQTVFHVLMETGSGAAFRVLMSL
jgi:hypothetical protein